LRLRGFPLLLQHFYLHFLLIDVLLDEAEEAHVYIGDPYEGETGYDVSPPVGQQQFVAREAKDGNGHIMAEAVFAGKEVKEFSLKDRIAFFTAFNAIFPWLAKNLFVGHRPGDTGYGYSQYK